MRSLIFAATKKFAFLELSLKVKSFPQILSLMPQSFKIEANDFEIILSTVKFRTKLLESIRNAKKRIYISALYLENDQAGNEILESLYTAKQRDNKIDIKVFIDFHRAQRGLIGSKKSVGNIKGYFEYQQKYNTNINIYGVPVKTKELLGVFHFKGFVIDDTLIYSGASLNNVYLQFNSRYRLDRYFFIKSSILTNSFVNFYTKYLLTNNKAVKTFDSGKKIEAKSIKKDIIDFTNKMLSASFQYPCSEEKSIIRVKPLYGLGKKNNELNNTIEDIIKSTKQKLTIYTPYFNFPPVISSEIENLLNQKSINVTIIVGDKTANDFYISPEKEFKKIGIIPYLYEQNLKKFVTNNQKYIDKGLLNILLWKNADNTFHLKGVEIDNTIRLLTGNNLNPRAWALDMENGILIHDKNQELKQQFDKEYTHITKHCSRIKSVESIESKHNYPKKIKKYLNIINFLKIDKLFKRFM